MTWIALADHHGGVFARNGLSKAESDPKSDSPADLDQVMPRGSILLETRVSPDDRPQIVLGLERGLGQGLRFTLQALPGGGMSMVLCMQIALKHLIPH